LFVKSKVLSVSAKIAPACVKNARHNFISKIRRSLFLNQGITEKIPEPAETLRRSGDFPFWGRSALLKL
jgi:hypothetical protein